MELMPYGPTFGPDQGVKNKSEPLHTTTQSSNSCSSNLTFYPNRAFEDTAMLPPLDVAEIGTLNEDWLTVHPLLNMLIYTARKVTGVSANY